jgi:Mor family transcriptional regulator
MRRPAPAPAPFRAADEDLLKILPPVLRAAVRALGAAKAQEWLADYGGRNLYIPKRGHLGIGLRADELARLNAALAPHLDGCRRVTLPKADKLLAYWRNAALRRDRERYSLAELAIHYRLTVRHVQNILNEDGGIESTQGSLF